MTIRMHEDEIGVDETLVRNLLRSQMPTLSQLPLVAVEPWGTDNAIWRLGSDLVIRLPRIHWAAGQVEFEARWLPRLAPDLPVTIPEPIAIGEPSEEYRYRWAVHRWIPGEGAALDRMDDPSTFGLALAKVVRMLQAVSTKDAPPAQNRARPLAEYDEATRSYIDHASHLIDAAAAIDVWEEALAATWVQGDLEGNCLVRDGRLCGIVDWGSACAGDPSVDIQVVWSPLFTEESRRAFLEALEVDEACIARSRGAAIHQACGALPYYLYTYPAIVERSWRKLETLGVHPLTAAYPAARIETAAE